MTVPIDASSRATCEARVIPLNEKRLRRCARPATPDQTNGRWLCAQHRSVQLRRAQAAEEERNER